MVKKEIYQEITFPALMKSDGRINGYHGVLSLCTLKEPSQKSHLFDSGQIFLTSRFFFFFYPLLATLSTSCFLQSLLRNIFPFKLDIGGKLICCFPIASQLYFNSLLPFQKYSKSLVGTYGKGDKIPQERSEQLWANLFGFWISKLMDYILKSAAVKEIAAAKIYSFFHCSTTQPKSLLRKMKSLILPSH